MPLSARRWKQLTESRYAHERAALEFLHDALPDRDLIFVYSNFEFIGDDGTVNEIDELAVTQGGVFLVELKSRRGIVIGNLNLWRWTKDNHTITVDTPPRTGQFESPQTRRPARPRWRICPCLFETAAVSPRPCLNVTFQIHRRGVKW
jgi:hypothetical protein